ncbi:MAG: phosphate signaling complex PhoU family protein [Actinomycetota bacterium]
MREGFQEELDALSGAVLEEGRVAAHAVSEATRALVDWSVDAFDATLAAEADLKRRYVETEAQVETVLARQAPVASDLRMVLAVLHINRSLERAAHNAARVAHLATPPPRRALVEEAVITDALRAMGERGAEMLRTSVDAFDRRDPGADRLLAALDELIDRENEKIAETILSIDINDPELRQWASRMLFAGRWLERVGDHAVNVGERVTYMVTGEAPNVEHTG